MWFDAYAVLAEIEKEGAADLHPPRCAQSLTGPPEAAPRVAQVARVVRPPAQKLEIAFCESDSKTLLDLLQREGPQTYGAAAAALGWGASRAWRAEASLKAAGLVLHGLHGKAHPVAGGSQFAAAKEIQRVDPPNAPEKISGAPHASP
jgi:hypothetical protein